MSSLQIRAGDKRAIAWDSAIGSLHTSQDWVRAPKILAPKILAPKILASKILASKILASKLLASKILARCRPIPWRYPNDLSPEFARRS